MKIEYDHNGQKGYTKITCSHAEALEDNQGRDARLFGAPVMHGFALEPKCVFFCCEWCFSQIQKVILLALPTKGLKVTIQADVERMQCKIEEPTRQCGAQLPTKILGAVFPPLCCRLPEHHEGEHKWAFTGSLCRFYEIESAIARDKGLGRCSKFKDDEHCFNPQQCLRPDTHEGAHQYV